MPLLEKMPGGKHYLNTNFNEPLICSSQTHNLTVRCYRYSSGHPAACTLLLLQSLSWLIFTFLPKLRALHSRNRAQHLSAVTGENRGSCGQPRADAAEGPLGTHLAAFPFPHADGFRHLRRRTPKPLTATLPSEHSL